MARVYTVRSTFTNPGAITLCQIVLAATTDAVVLRAWCFCNLTTNAQQPIQLNRKSGAATVTAASAGTTLLLRDTNDGTTGLTLSTTGTGVLATGEGTDTDVPIHEYFNLPSGWLYLPVPEERESIPPSGIFGLKLPSAPPAGTYSAGIRILVGA